MTGPDLDAAARERAAKIRRDHGPVPAGLADQIATTLGKAPVPTPFEQGQATGRALLDAGDGPTEDALGRAAGILRPAAPPTRRRTA